jgi:nucleolar protein 15
MAPLASTKTSFAELKKSSTVTMMGKKSKKPVPEPESSSAEEDESEDQDEDDGCHLHGFSTDDDSSDEEVAMDDEPSTFDFGKLPTVAKDDATVKQKLEKAKRQPTEDRGVLFIGRLPHGFYEDQLKAYFSQFGNVTRLRVSRNKKTGKSKHYGFIEFDSSSVAQIVSDTMDNYLIMGHILRCKLIPKDQVHPELWVGANRKWRAVPSDRLTRVEHNKPRTTLEQMRANKRLLKRQNERKRKLEQAGIKYDFEPVGYKKAKLFKSRP